MSKHDVVAGGGIKAESAPNLTTEAKAASNGDKVLPTDTNVGAPLANDYWLLNYREFPGLV